MNSDVGRHVRQGQAAVLIAVSGEGANQRLLLTRRAEHLHKHRGEVAFPGGKWEPGDNNLLATALRESFEEVDLQARDVCVIGQLSTCYTRAGVAVTPFVALVSENLQLRPNPEELQALFWVPMDYFLEDRRERTDIFQHSDLEEWAPVYHFEGHKIWGFTARLITEFVSSYCGIKIARQHCAPERIYQGL